MDRRRIEGEKKMNAKIIYDSNRVIITFSNIENPEEFLQKVVDIVSGNSDKKIVPEVVQELDPPPTDTESYEDFEAPFTGKTPQEVFCAPKFQGFYFLCQTKIPKRYAKECNKLLWDYVQSKSLCSPPYGKRDRMLNYMKMATNILGEKVVPMITADITDDELDIICESTEEKLLAFFESRKP